MMTNAYLYDPREPRDACGIGFVADANGVPSRAIVEAGIEALCRVVHRGAVAADAKTGDGAGLLFPIPKTVFGDKGVAMVFARGDATALIEEAAAAEGLTDLEWRDVPTDPEALGDFARAAEPEISQLLFTTDSDDPEEKERRTYRARRRAERLAIERGVEVYFPSWSFRTVVYKGLIAAPELANFYLDLADERFVAPFAIFHQRYSTNTTPTWERAQPFRFLCHNGEINAIQGNINQMRAREGRLGTEEIGLAPEELLRPVIDPAGSDSAKLDNVVELLLRAGRDVRHTMHMLVPDAWESRDDVPLDLRGFYRYHSCLIEPWDGPAGLVFTDGIRVGATLDRNGLRPMRMQVCEDGLVIVSSEVGTVNLEGHGAVKRGKLSEGQIVCVDPTQGPDVEAAIQDDTEVKRFISARKPFAEWAERLTRRNSGTPDADIPADMVARQAAFGVTKEENTVIVEPMAKYRKEPTSSMGDDTQAPFLTSFARPLFNFFKQRFAQVTNPPIDHLRERVVMSKRTLIGPRAKLLVAGPEAADLFEYDSFVVYPEALDDLFVDAPWGTALIDATFPVAGGPDGLEAALRRIGDEAEDAVRKGVVLLVVSDRAVSADRAPIPSLAAIGAVHHKLVRAGLRTQASIVCDSGEPRETHHFACLVGYGADLICPYLTFAHLAERASKGMVEGIPLLQALENYRYAIEDGVLKIMSKMGISTVDSYRGAQIFEAYGLGRDVIELCFDGTFSTIWGIGLRDLGEDALRRHADGFGKPKARLVGTGFIKYKHGGEYHAANPEVVEALHDVVGSGTNRRQADLEKAAHALRAATRDPGDPGDPGERSNEQYATFARLVNERPPSTPRDLLEFVTGAEPIPLEEVEPASEICKRFSSGAISHGSISREAHETLAMAFNMIGGRGNTGEGGEDPNRFRTKGGQRDRNCKIKQVASGRFGVTPEYASWADELQIKMAQGSKPGEGGQLPGHKVSAEIARLRHTQPGVSLISPPPHHDIYSIEDLAQLIFDLKQVNPRADVSVKLVATTGVGTIAAGVAKGLAEVVMLSGADGGTGASPLSSIKHAGLPWELGLAETQQTLVAEGLRSRVRVRVDGGFRTGRDVMMATLLGADEYSFGTAPLLAEGCIMVRTCHRDTCPVGIATQRPDLRAKFQGTPEMVAAYLFFVAEEVRRTLASLGLRSVDEAIGRTDLLRRKQTGDHRADSADLEWLLHDARTDRESPTHFIEHIEMQRARSELGRRVKEEAIFAVRTGDRAVLHYPITNADRTVGAELGGEIAFHFGEESPPGEASVRFVGQAGQSFGAFLASGVDFTLVGEANDYVGKGMNGGRIVIVPPPDDAGDPVLMGNTVLYGATGGELFCAGQAGARFAVRNSGALAVIEGAGMHACEYMTGGWVVILGPVGNNLGAGMTGGQAFVYDPTQTLPAKVNTELVSVAQANRDQLEIVREFVENHVLYTSSKKANEILNDWEHESRHFFAVVPKTDVAKIEARKDGLGREDEAEALVAAGGNR
jgi:glutamate synthase domain-containing protein 2/glutamate synthase domain-containing protein 1/glutamate synthase domain-containing protein 3